MVISIQQTGEIIPQCDECGVRLCWGIDEIEYQECKRFWDQWRCRDCNPNYKNAYQSYKQQYKITFDEC